MLKKFSIAGGRALFWLSRVGTPLLVFALQPSLPTDSQLFTTKHGQEAAYNTIVGIGGQCG